MCTIIAETPPRLASHDVRSHSRDPTEMEGRGPGWHIYPLLWRDLLPIVIVPIGPILPVVLVWFLSGCLTISVLCARTPETNVLGNAEEMRLYQSVCKLLTMLLAQMKNACCFK